MPLCMEASSERTQRILWDPNDSTQIAEALDRLRELKERGFCVVDGGMMAGELVMAPPSRPPDTGLMRILSDNGDDRIVWSRRAANEVREAYDKFKEMLDKGYRAFAILASGKRGHELFSFDPMIEEILMVPTGSCIPG